MQNQKSPSRVIYYPTIGKKIQVVKVDFPSLANGKIHKLHSIQTKRFFKPFLGFSFFPPGQEYEFKVTKGEYEFSSLVGLLGGTEFQTQVSGKFKIYSGETLLKEWDLTGLSKERWFSKKEILEIREQQLLRLVWESGDSYLFVGEPLLYQIEGFGFESQESRKPKSVILIVIDSARKDFLGLMVTLILSHP